ncbi:MAG: hypothetical protein H0S82_03355, partial [Anaerolineaceae bacterium]|nr:hypothetical protein [Anaerolineaceae bacterium]
MKKISLILLLTVAMLSTLGCGLFSAVTSFFTDETEEVVQQPVDDLVVADEPVVTEEVIVTEEVVEDIPVGDSVVVLFQDDFSDVTSGWDRNDWDNGYTDYVDGAYQVQVKVENYDVWANPSRYFDGDVSVEVDATKVAGELDDNFGI